MRRFITLYSYYMGRRSRKSSEDSVGGVKGELFRVKYADLLLSTAITWEEESYYRWRRELLHGNTDEGEVKGELFRVKCADLLLSTARIGEEELVNQMKTA